MSEFIRRGLSQICNVTVGGTSEVFVADHYVNVFNALDICVYNTYSLFPSRGLSIKYVCRKGGREGGRWALTKSVRLLI